MLTNIKKLDFDNEDEVKEFLEEVRTLSDFDLTRMQVKFVQNIVDGMNQTKAAIEAGTLSKNPAQIGSELAKTPKVSLAIQWYGSRMLQASLIDRDSLVDKALFLYEDCVKDNDKETARKTLEMLFKAGGLLEKNPVKVPQSKVRTDEDKEAPFQEFTEQSKVAPLGEAGSQEPVQQEKSPEDILTEGMDEWFNSNNLNKDLAN